MGLAGLLLTADGDPAERARLAEVQIETLDLLFGRISSDEPDLSPTLRLAAVRAAINALHVWCPLLREAEKVAAENALCLAAASLDLSRIVADVDGGPDLSCGHGRSWDAFVSGTNVNREEQERILTALSIKRQLLRLTADLELEAAREDVAAADRRRHAKVGMGSTDWRPTSAMQDADAGG